MELGLIEFGPIELVLGLFVVIVALAYLARRVGVAYPILLVLGGLVLGYAPGLPHDRARAGRRLPAAPAADPVRRGLLDADPRLQGQRPADRAAGGRARAVHDGRGRERGLPAGPVDGSGGGVRARGDRRAARRGGRDLDLPAHRRPAADRDDPRGREPGQRRVGADRLPVRGRGRGDRHLRAGQRRHRVRLRRARRGRRRAAGRLPGDGGVEAHRGPDARDHGLAPGAVRGLPAGRGARRQRGPGRRRGGSHRRAPSRPGPVAECAADGPVGVEHRHLHDQRHRVHADRAAAAEHPRRS